MDKSLFSAYNIIIVARKFVTFFNVCNSVVGKIMKLQLYVAHQEVEKVYSSSSMSKNMTLKLILVYCLGQVHIFLMKIGQKCVLKMWMFFI